METSLRNMVPAPPRRDSRATIPAAHHRWRWALLALLMTLGRTGLAQTCTTGTSTVAFRGGVTGTYTSTSTEEDKHPNGATPAPEAVRATSFSYSNYLSTAPGASSTAGTANDAFQLVPAGIYGNLDGRVLAWRQVNSTVALTASTGSNGTPAGSYVSTDNNNGTPFYSTVTLTFTREVSNLTFVTQDIDKGTLAFGNTNVGGSDFTDELDLYALNGAGNRVALSAGNVSTVANINVFEGNKTVNGVVQDAVRGTGLNGTTNGSSRTGNVTITFTSPVKSVRLTFRNLNTVSGTTTRIQSIAFEQISWCSQADLTTTLTTPTPTVLANGTGQFDVTFANVGDITTAATTQRVQLPAGVTNVAATNGGVYNSGSNTVTYTTAAATALANYGSTPLSSSITFTAPGTGPLNATSSITSATTEGPSADPNPNTDNASIAVTYALTGSVFEDVNYGGGAGRSLVASNGVPRPNARVELYDATGLYVTATTTDANGRYSFIVGSTGNYTVRVVNNTVTSSRGGYTAALIPVQTYNGASAVGGADPAKYDAANGTTGTALASLNTVNTIAESQALVTVTTASVTTDFGFNFDTVVNTRDVATVSGNNAQGTLRQFILNSNALSGEGTLAQAGSYTNPENLATGSTAAGRAGVALPAGVETSIFMIPVAALTGGVAVITPAAALPQVTGPATVINGGTQTFNIGNTNDVLLGTGGTVGTGATALNRLNGPEVQLNGSTAVAAGLRLAGTGSSIRGLAIYGFGNIIEDNTTGNVLVAGSNITLVDNVIGSTAISFTVPGTVTNAANVRVISGTGVSLSSNLIGFAGGSGVAVVAAVTGTNLTGNEIRGNARTNTIYDGIDAHGSSLAVTGNLFAANAAQGFDSFSSAGSNVVTGNTFSGNGVGNAGSAPQETGAARFYGTGNSFSQNISTGNYGAGVQVVNGTTTILQNSIFNNGTITSANGSAVTGQIGIDLLAGTDNADRGTAPYVTINDNGDGDTGGNGLLNFPVITSATVVGTNLVVQGFASPGALIELYAPGTTADPSGFGEGQTYLGTVTEGGTAGATAGNTTNLATDTNGGTGTYGPANVNGRNQGTETNQNRFTFIIPLTGSFAGLVAGNLLTSTATLSNATSEFSGNVTVNAGPVPNTLTNVNIPDTNGATVLNPNLSSSVAGTLSNGTANSIQYYTIASLPTTGTITYNGTVLTASNIAATQITPALLGTLTYTPVFGVAGTVSFTYTSTDANNVTSGTNNNGGTITNGPATYTIPVVEVADVTTVVTGPATLNAGQPSGTYLASFTNNGPNTAAGVTQKVTLPAGASLSTQQQADLVAAYPGTTVIGGVIYFTGQQVSLTSGATNTYSFAYTASGTTGSATLTSNVTTTTSQGTVTAAPDFFNLPVTVNSVADVVAAISGNGPKNAGATSTFTATFSNNGTQTATSLVPTVQLPAGLSGVVITPPTGLSFLYNSATGLVTFTATPTGGAIASLPVGTGSALVATIAYTQPIGAVTATAAISTTSNEAGLTANNQNAATISSNTVFDVATTIYGPATATAGGQVAYNVTTSNNGPSAAPNVVQTITLPTGATNIFVTGNATISGTSVTFPAIASLAAGQTVNNTVSFSAPSSDYSVSASVTPSTAGGDTNGANNTQTASTTVTAPPVTTTFANAFVTVGVATTATPGTPVTAVDAGTSVTFTVTEGNNGRDAATGVVTRIAIPTGLPISGVNALKIGLNGGTPAAPTATSGTLATYGSGATAITYDSSTGIVTSGTTATQATGSGSYQTYALVFNAPVSGVVTATADVSTTTIDNVPANNVATAQVSVNPALTDVATTITGPAAATAGALLSYTVTTTNNGPAPANSVVQLANIPAGLPVTGTNALLINGAAPTSVATSAGVTTASYGSGTSAITYNQNTGLVTFATIASQTVGATASNTIAYYAPANGNTNLNNTAEVSTTSPEGITTNNAAGVVTVLTPTADVQVAILGPASSFASGTLTYTVLTTNNGSSVAGTVVTTVQLPTGLSNVVVRDVNGSPLTNSATTGYNSADGIVRFTTQTNQAVGALDSSTGTITFDVPTNTNLIQPTATVVVSGSTVDPVERNNTATIATVIKPVSGTLIDMGTSISITTPNAPASVAAGSVLTYSVVTRNNTSGTTATNVVQTVELAPGLPTSGANALLLNGVSPTSVSATTGVATYPSGTYNPATGVATFLTASFPFGSVTNTLTLVVPGTSPQVATARVRGDQAEPTTGPVLVNVATSSVTVTLTPDVATAITGPSLTIAGAPVSYTVVTSVAGLSAVSGVTQTVKLPTGVTSYSLNGGALQTVASGATITIPVPATLNPGAANAVSNVISFAAPTASFSVIGFATATGDAGTTGNNTATQATAIINKAPIAANVVNRQQAPQSNSANTNQLPISALSATDPEGNAITYTVTKVPDATQGRLYYDNGGTYTLLTDTAPLPSLTPTQATTLRFDPTPGFVGNASFLYTATDALGAISNTATYLVPVGADNATVYTATPSKGGNTNQYANGDVLAFGIDPNGAVYNTAGQVYSATGGAPSAGTGAVSSGIAFGKLLLSDSTALAAIGIRYTSNTGLFTVVDRTKLPRAGRSTTVSITTLDLFGGITVQNFTLTTGQNPLPVELTDFTATAVKNVDAALVWRTASEKNNDHFDVERSLNSTDFVKIALVKGQGSTSAATSYALSDTGIGRKAKGLVYYRLKQVDTDGTATYSPVRTVAFTGTAAAEPAISLYPNPATLTTQLDLTSLPTGTYQVSVLDATGRVVLSATREAGLMQALDVNTIASGTYMVLVRGQNNGQLINLTKRLIKE